MQTLNTSEKITIQKNKKKQAKMPVLKEYKQKRKMFKNKNAKKTCKF